MSEFHIESYSSSMEVVIGVSILLKKLDWRVMPYTVLSNLKYFSPL